MAPISPTLTNPDMILPYGEYDSTPSPPLGPYRPSVPGDEWVDPIKDDLHFSLGPPHMGPATPTTPIIYGNGTMLSDIGEVTEAESTTGRKLPGPAERRLLRQTQQQNAHLGTPIRSSPTVGYEAITRRAKTGSHQRKISIESNSTITSEGQSAEMFKDFDDGVSVDDSNFQGDDEESVADSYSERVIASETQRLSMAESIMAQDDDQNSSAALSRRAEQILLNAKLRLNNMEGNLTRARSSLQIMPSRSMSSIHSSSPLSRSTPSPQNGRIISSLGNGPSKHRQLHTPMDSPIGSPGHSRVYSENSIVSPVRGERFPVRASSAAGAYNGRSGLSQRSPDIQEETRTPSRSGVSSPLARTSPPQANHLQPVNEDDVVSGFVVDEASLRARLDEGYFSPGGDHKGLTRSASTNQMRDLRDQMHDLKGRLSVLRDRARDDTMKRRSLQSLRTPSPFTAAEQWYTADKGYGNEPLSANAGVVHPPWKQEGDVSEDVDTQSAADDQGLPSHIPEYANSDVTSVYEDVQEGHPLSAIPPRTQEPRIEEESEPPSPQKSEPESVDEDDYNDEIVDADEADDYESDASMYHDSLDHPISHEDREDAFDYEHFFLHSAMGTIGTQSRRDSVGSFSSEDSVETTRGPIVQTTDSSGKTNHDGRRSLTHMRSESSASVSTIATFATAEEEPSSGDEEDQSENDQDDFSVREVDAPLLRTSTPITAKRTTFGGAPTDIGLASSGEEEPQERSASAPQSHDQNERNGNGNHRPSISSFDSCGSTGSTRSFPLVNKPKSSELIEKTRESKQSVLSNDSATLIDRQSTIDEERIQSSPVHMLAREDQILVERLVASLGKCVLGLQEAGRGSYDGRVWRRRLDAARRVLEGDEGAI
ncbi:hypothetical protein BGZ60DRAFT_433095 [Tricladium varicosporioides]|nr:hypothetical protein BGZ60DRAFT_433095 [Hymenoscyphus varicosporioides]